MHVCSIWGDICVWSWERRFLIDAVSILLVYGIGNKSKRENADSVWIYL